MSKHKPQGVSVHIQTDECDKMLAVRERSQTIGEFLDWLTGARELTICDTTRFDEYLPAQISTESLLAEYFEIDLDKAERERVALLKAIRASNDARNSAEATRHD